MISTENNIKIWEVTGRGVTKDYDKFKLIKENRDVTEKRKHSIMDSMAKIGLVPVEITVNEKWEVIDGQGRLAACRELDLPVYYQMICGLDVAECRTMNINQANWTMLDFVESYAKQGNENYVRLFDPKSKYSWQSLLSIVSLTLNRIGSGYGTSDRERVLSGEYKCSEQTYNKIDNSLNWVSSYIAQIKRAGGRSDFAVCALLFVKEHVNVDADDLIKKIAKEALLLPAWTNVPRALEAFDKVYNNKKTKNKVEFLKAYDEYASKEIAGYKTRYSIEAKRNEHLAV